MVAIRRAERTAQFTGDRAPPLSVGRLSISRSAEEADVGIPRTSTSIVACVWDRRCRSRRDDAGALIRYGAALRRSPLARCSRITGRPQRGPFIRWNVDSPLAPGNNALMDRLSRAGAFRCNTRPFSICCVLFRRLLLLRTRRWRATRVSRSAGPLDRRRLWP